MLRVEPDRLAVALIGLGVLLEYVLLHEAEVAVGNRALRVELDAAREWRVLCLAVLPLSLIHI